jgi:peptidoglycan DL-endopeptidase CwlO
VRDKARFLYPGLAATLTLVGILVVGPSSAPGAAPAARPGTGPHRLSQPAPGGTTLAGGLIDRAPAPGLGLGRPDAFSLPVSLLASRKPSVAPLGTLRPADLLVVAPDSLPRGALAAVLRLRGVSAAETVDAARLHLNGKLVAMLGVDPSGFRAFAGQLTAESDKLWQSVAGGSIAVSYTMGKLDRLPLGGLVSLDGTRPEKLRVGSFATVGIPGVDAVVSDPVARSLGFPAGNSIVISAPHANLSSLSAQIQRVLPRDATVDPLVSQAGTPAADGMAGIAGVTARSINGYPTLTTAELDTMLRAALSRRGMPYVWGGDGPDIFDCSGLVQWSFRQAGVVMPRVAADQAMTGPSVPISELEPGDLLFYHTDPSDPTYISHVALYLGHGMMIQAPEPGMDVEVVPAVFGSGFAGAVRVDPELAARVAADSV